MPPMSWRIPHVGLHSQSEDHDVNEDDVVKGVVLN